MSDGQCPGMKAKDLFLGFPIPLDMPWPPSALLGVPSCGSWCPGAAEPAREGLGIQGLGEARPARKGTVLTFVEVLMAPGDSAKGSGWVSSSRSSLSQVSRGFSLSG